MGTMAFQITCLTIVHLTVYSGADQRKHQSSASLAFVRGIHRWRWIPRTKGQLRGKCFHLVTSSWPCRKMPKADSNTAGLCLWLTDPSSAASSSISFRATNLSSAAISVFFREWVRDRRDLRRLKRVKSWWRPVYCSWFPDGRSWLWTTRHPPLTPESAGTLLVTIQPHPTPPPASDIKT